MADCQLNQNAGQHENEVITVMITKAGCKSKSVKGAGVDCKKNGDSALMIAYAIHRGLEVPMILTVLANIMTRIGRANIREAVRYDGKRTLDHR